MQSKSLRRTYGFQVRVSPFNTIADCPKNRLELNRALFQKIKAWSPVCFYFIWRNLDHRAARGTLLGFRKRLADVGRNLSAQDAAKIRERNDRTQGPKPTGRSAAVEDLGHDASVKHRMTR